jgi:uncharacterized protein YcbK (DUF882 family)
LYETTNFTAKTDPKLACSCCGKGGASIALLIVLEDVKRHFAAGVGINSCARCTSYNKSERGTKNSEHRIDDESPWSDAADITVTGVTPTKVYSYLKSTPYANLLGLGKYKDFTHVDVRGYPARW